MLRSDSVENTNNAFIKYINQNKSIILEKQKKNPQWWCANVKYLLERVLLLDLPDSYFHYLKSDEFMYEGLVEYKGASNTIKYCEMFVRIYDLPPINMTTELLSMTEIKDWTSALEEAANVKSFVDFDFANDFLIGTPFAKNYKEKSVSTKYTSGDGKKTIIVDEDTLGVKSYHYNEISSHYTREYIRRRDYIKDLVKFKRTRCREDFFIEKERNANGEITVFSSDPYFIRMNDVRFDKSRSLTFIEKNEKYMKSMGSPEQGKDSLVFVSRKAAIKVKFNANSGRAVISMLAYRKANELPEAANVRKICLVMWPFWLKNFVVNGDTENTY